MKLTVCAEMFFVDLPFLDRIQAIADAGYKAVEFWAWRSKDIAAIKRITHRTGLSVSSFILETEAVLVDPGTHEQLVRGADETFAVARELGCRSVIALTGNERRGVPRAEQHAAIVAGLRLIARSAEAAGVTIVLEPLNKRVETPDYFLTSSDEGAQIVHAVGSPSVRLLFDIYHQQVSEGDLSVHLEEHREIIGHIHVAGVPGRGDPGNGEINYPFLMDQLRRWPYKGYIGLEYSPDGDPRQSLQRTADLLLT